MKTFRRTRVAVLLSYDAWMGLCRFTIMTPGVPGAIGVIQLHGDVVPVLTRLCACSGAGVDHWPIGRIRLCDFAGIDEGLAGRIDERVAQIMPHGGPRVIQRLAERLMELGAEAARAEDVDPRELYPEASDRIEEVMLHTLANAASPLAQDVLLRQPEVWTQRLKRELSADETVRSERLNRLLVPPLVVVAGPANVGKSTLSNALIGRSMSIALDLPGTTRDYTTARVELAGLVVQWHDTPGLRASEDPIEQRAVELARRLMQQADLLIAMTDHEQNWPELPRVADVRVANKCDLARRDDADCAISATSGEGIDKLVRLVRERLVPAAEIEAAKQHPWVFDARLKAKPQA